MDRKNLVAEANRLLRQHGYAWDGRSLEEKDGREARLVYNLPPKR